MGRSVKVNIGGREFSKKAAVDYFMDQREAVKGSGPLREGQFFDDLRELYTRYCEVTNWDLSNRVIYAFSVDYEPRKNDQTWASIFATGCSFHLRTNCPFRSGKQWMRSQKLLLNNTSVSTLFSVRN